MGNCASSRKTFSRTDPEVSPVLAKIRAAQQKYFDDNIEGREDGTDSDSDTDDEESVSYTHLTLPTSSTV